MRLSQCPALYDTPRGAVAVTRMEDDYVITGPSGVHRLCVAGTPRMRLAAHVEGFLTENGWYPAYRTHMRLDVQLQCMEAQVARAADFIVSCLQARDVECLPRAIKTYCNWVRLANAARTHLEAARR